MIIYKLIFPTGKIYIGQTVKTMEHRLRQHQNAANAGSLLAIHAAWRKHGAPMWEILGEYSDMAALHAAEIAAIAEYDCISPGGYNLCSGGETAPSSSPLVAAKIAAKAKGRKLDDRHRATLVERNNTLWADPEYRAKVSAGVKAAWTPEMRAKAAARASARKGEKRSDEAKANLRAAKANISAETRAKMSAAAKGKAKPPRTEATRAKFAANAKASWADPEIRARRQVAIKAAKAGEVWTEERREALRQRNRERFAKAKET